MPYSLKQSLELHALRLVRLSWIAAWCLTAGLLVAAALMPAHRLFLAVYIAPLLPTGAWWLSLRQRALHSATETQVWADLGAFILGGLRLFGGWGLLPHSGHMLFLTYTISTTSNWRFRAWAVILFAMTTTYKLGIRRDWWSWTWGLALGCLAALLWAYRRPVPAGD